MQFLSPELGNTISLLITKDLIFRLHLINFNTLLNRNTGTSIAGKNIANPISMMNAAADLLHHLQLENHSTWLREAIEQTITVDRIHTPGQKQMTSKSLYVVYVLVGTDF